MKFSRLIFYCAILSGCHRETLLEIPEITDQPKVETISRGEISEIAPASGIVVAGGKDARFEVNIEAEDASAMKPGLAAKIFVSGQKKETPAKVTRILKNVSSETGQAVAWLEASIDPKPLIGDFVRAEITLRTKRGVLKISDTAILIKEGKSYIIRVEKSEKTRYEPIEVKTGIISNGIAEITDGAQENMTAVTEGGIGFLFPDFKASQQEAGD